MTPSSARSISRCSSRSPARSRLHRGGGEPTAILVTIDSDLQITGEIDDLVISAQRESRAV